MHARAPYFTQHEGVCLIYNGSQRYAINSTKERGGGGRSSAQCTVHSAQPSAMALVRYSYLECLHPFAPLCTLLPVDQWLQGTVQSILNFTGVPPGKAKYLDYAEAKQRCGFAVGDRGYTPGHALSHCPTAMVDSLVDPADFPEFKLLWQRLGYDYDQDTAGFLL